ncbi:MAG: hypothetical protein WCB05_20805 [Candidatus Sulfotelmatobacter sp.]
MRKETQTSCEKKQCGPCPTCLAEDAILQGLSQHGPMSEPTVFLLVLGTFPSVAFARVDIDCAIANLVAGGKVDWSHGWVGLTGNPRKKMANRGSKKAINPPAAAFAAAA